MKWSSMLVAAIAVLVPSVEAEFNQCLGVEIAQLPSIEHCNILYDACEAGVSKLNQQLKKPMNHLFHPVSLVSATKSKSKVTNDTTVALLVQLAPIERCIYTTQAPASGAASSEKCTFAMEKVEIYSLLLQHQKPNKWSLDGFKHHALSKEERDEIVSEYKSGKYFGSNLAIGIFDSNVLPAESVRDSADKAFTRSPLGIFAVFMSALFAVGLLAHHRRRLHNGYAPISKRGQVQGKTVSGQQYTDPRRGANGATAAEEVSLKQETNERFAV